MTVFKTRFSYKSCFTFFLKNAESPRADLTFSLSFMFSRDKSALIFLVLSSCSVVIFCSNCNRIISAYIFRLVLSKSAFFVYLSNCFTSRSICTLCSYTKSFSWFTIELTTLSPNSSTTLLICLYDFRISSPMSSSSVLVLCTVVNNEVMKAFSFV